MGREWELPPYYSKEIGNKIKQHVSCKEFLYQTWHTWPGVACIGSGMGGGIKCVSSCCASWGLVYHRSGSKWRRGSLVQVRLQTGREPLLCMCSGPFENRKMNWSLTKNWDAQKRVCRNAAMDSETYWIANGWLRATSEKKHGSPLQMIHSGARWNKHQFWWRCIRWYRGLCFCYSATSESYVMCRFTLW